MSASPRRAHAYATCPHSGLSNQSGRLRLGFLGPAPWRCGADLIPSRRFTNLQQSKELLATFSHSSAESYDKTSLVRPFARCFSRPAECWDFCLRGTPGSVAAGLGTYVAPSARLAAVPWRAQALQKSAALLRTLRSDLDHIFRRTRALRQALKRRFPEEPVLQGSAPFTLDD